MVWYSNVCWWWEFFFVLWTVSLHDSALYTVNRSEAAGGIVSESFRVGLVFENLFDAVLDRWNIHQWEWGVFENSHKTPRPKFTHVCEAGITNTKCVWEGVVGPTGSFNIDAASLSQQQIVHATT